MQTSNLLSQKNDFGIIAFVALVALAISLFAPIGAVPFIWGGIALLTIMVLWANFGDIMTLILIWFVTVACFSYYFWSHPIPVPGMGSFNITIDRLMILVVSFTAFIAVLTGRLPVKSAPNVLRVILLLLLFFTISLVHSGFSSIAEVSPHFRLAGGYYFPTIALILTYFAVNDEPQIKKICWFFFFLGLYLTFTAWAEHFKLWSLVFPKYISNPEYGIHWGRARGPFLVSPSLGITLVFCFFNNVFLATRSKGFPKFSLYLINILMLPAIFFTHTRSVWLSLIVCTIVWLALKRGMQRKAVIVLILVTATLVGGAIFAENVVSPDRTRGGVTDPYPIYARIGLAKMTWRMFKEYPLLGVGFGHFRDHAAHYTQDPASKYIRYGSQLMEHNNFLSILAEGGIVGFSLYIFVLIVIFRHSLNLYRRIPPGATGWVSREFVILYWVLMIDYLIDGMLRETSVDPFNNGLFFVYTGLILAVDYLLDFRGGTQMDARRFPN